MTTTNFNAIDIQGKEDQVTVINHTVKASIVNARNKDIDMNFVNLMKTNKLPMFMEEVSINKPETLTIGLGIREVKMGGANIMEALFDKFAEENIALSIVHIDELLLQADSGLQDLLVSETESEDSVEETNEVDSEDIADESGIEIVSFDLEEKVEEEQNTNKKVEETMTTKHENVEDLNKDAVSLDEIKKRLDSSKTEASKPKEAKKETASNTKFERTNEGSFDDDAFDDVTESIISREEVAQASISRWWDKANPMFDLSQLDQWMVDRAIPELDITFKFGRDKNFKTGEVNKHGFVMEINFNGLASKFLRFEAIEGIGHEGKLIKFLSAKNFYNVSNTKSASFINIAYGKWVSAKDGYKFQRYFNHGLTEDAMQLSMILANAFFEKHFSTK